MAIDMLGEDCWTLEAMRRLRGPDLAPVPPPEDPVEPPPITHDGSRARYNQGCRCDGCKAANTAYYHQRKAAKARPGL